jgi:cysteine-rich repeat protein
MQLDPHAIGLGCLVAAVLVAVAPHPAAAQTQVAFRNGDGEWEWKDVEPEPSFGLKGAPDIETVAGTFRVFYYDLLLDTGVGFDDPVSGAARRNTLRAVLEYIASVLDVPGTADLDVLASQTDGTGALATAGPYLLPELGFQAGFVYEHLTTGADPLALVSDGTIVIDFGFTWNSDTDPVSGLERDLYTALLHEASHALGIVSIVGSDARSVLLNTEQAGGFTFFDAFLIRESTETAIVLEGGAYNADADDMSSGDLAFAGERARGSFGGFPPVFSPDPFLPGSSIGHWSLDAGPDAVMRPELPVGIERRRYTAWELQALGDLGYDVVACGDGFIAGAEECDDANDDDLDGCTARCELEDGVDGGAPDSGVPDGGTLDSGVPDAGAPDAGVPDAGPPIHDPDAGAPTDASIPPSVPFPDRGPGDDPAEDPPLFATVSSPPDQGCAVRRGDSAKAWLAVFGWLMLRSRRRLYGFIV